MSRAAACALLLCLTGACTFYSADMGAREAAVIQDIKAIFTAQIQYKSQYGKYAGTLSELAPPASGVPEGPQAAGLISSNLASGERHGYTFVLTVTDDSYTLNANPKVFNSSGRRTFYCDQTGAIRQNWSNQPATAGSEAFR